MLNMKNKEIVKTGFEKYLDELNFQFEDVPAQVLAFL